MGCFYQTAGHGARGECGAVWRDEQGTGIPRWHRLGQGMDLSGRPFWLRGSPPTALAVPPCLCDRHFHPRYVNLRLDPPRGTYLRRLILLCQTRRMDGVAASSPNPVADKGNRLHRLLATDKPQKSHRSLEQLPLKSRRTSRRSDGDTGEHSFFP